MKRIVVDSSVVIKFLNQHHEENIKQADKLLGEILGGEAELFAPELVKYEIGNLLVINKKLTQSESKIVLAALYSLPIEFVSQTSELSIDSHAIASEFGLNFNESVFLALAEWKDAIYITDIESRKVKPQGVKLVQLKDY
jgi:predicted nucleic acid-binding protein